MCWRDNIITLASLHDYEILGHEAWHHAAPRSHAERSVSSVTGSRYPGGRGPAELRSESLSSRSFKQYPGPLRLLPSPSRGRTGVITDTA